tara:strand:- start:10360 stop:10599 length:240 start_codon:yes stop_codon:yes gene_type:complete
MRKITPPKTLEMFLKELEAQNKTVAEWARERNLDLNVVYMVVRGRAVGRRGKCRQAMHAMGIQLPPMHNVLTRSGAAHV